MNLNWNFGKLELIQKMWLIAILILSSLWYLSLYLFAETFFIKAPFQIPIIASLSMACLWFLVFMMIIPKPKRDDSVEAGGEAMAHSTIYLALGIMISVVFRPHFLTFFWWLIIYPMLMLIITIIKDARTRLKEKKEDSRH